MVQIYHNPRCSKSRQAVQILRDAGVTPEIILYQKTPLDAAGLAGLIARLDGPATALLRAREAAALVPPPVTEAEIIAALVANPSLMERPIVVSAKGAVIARPPERALEIL